MRAYRVGIAGPVGSGKTALLDQLSKRLWPRVNLAVVTNGIYTKEDAEFLMRQGTLPMDRVRGVETGGCPHAAIREAASMNLDAIDDLERAHAGLELLFVESGGDNLAAAFSPELVDTSIYVIDVSGGDKIPRKGGPGIRRSGLLVINKIDLAPQVGASLALPKIGKLAVRVRFELTEPVKVQRFSRPPHSTTLPPHRNSILPDSGGARSVRFVVVLFWFTRSFHSRFGSLA